MENRSNSVIIIVLLLISVGLGSFIFYDKVLDNETSKEKENNSQTVQNTNQEIQNNNYNVFSKNLKESLSKLNDSKRMYQSIRSEFVKGGYDVYLKENGSLYVKFYDSELNSKYNQYKLADNVLSFYIINVGQDTFNTLYFINQDGTVSYCNIESDVLNNNGITIKNDLEYKNIVSITSGVFGTYSGAHGPFFIDIDGNVYSNN